MAGTRGDITVAEQRALVDTGIKLRFAGSGVEIARPADKIHHRTDRPVAVKRFYDEPARSDIARHIGDRSGGGWGQEAPGLLVARERRAEEIRRTGIAEVGTEPRHDGSGVDECSGPF